MKCFDSFYEEASYALSRLLKVEPELADTGCGVCHGAYHYHNVLILPDYSVATVNFESMCYQPYLLDLYLFLRKTLEKNHYDYSFFEAGISGYSIYRRLAEKRFSFLLLPMICPWYVFLSDTTGVMKNGKLVEMAPTKELFENPQHPYTQSLLSAIHIPDPLEERKRRLIEYEEPQSLGEGWKELSACHCVRI